MWGTEFRTPMGLASPRMRGSAACRTRPASLPDRGPGAESGTFPAAAVATGRDCGASHRRAHPLPSAGQPPADRATPVALSRRRTRPPGPPPRRLARLWHELGDPRTGHAGAAGPRQEARLAAAPRALRRRDGAPAQQGGQPAARQRPDRRRGDPAGRDVLVQQGGRQLHSPQGVRRRHAAHQRRCDCGRRWRHLPAGQPAALDVPALAAHRGRAVRAQLRPVPRQEPRAALGRRVLDRLELRRPRASATTPT